MMTMTTSSSSSVNPCDRFMAAPLLEEDRGFMAVQPEAADHRQRGHRRGERVVGKPAHRGRQRNRRDAVGGRVHVDVALLELAPVDVVAGNRGDLVGADGGSE